MTKLNSEALVDNLDNHTKVYRNNVNRPVIMFYHRCYTVVSINDTNMRKLEKIEKHKIPFILELEGQDEVGNQLKSVVSVSNSDGSRNHDLSVVCILERRKSVWDTDQIRDYNVYLFRQSLIEKIRALSCQYIGVHLVATWDDGGSDANDLPLYTAADFIRQYPDADKNEVVTLYEGKGDGFIARQWTDEHNRKVVDRVFYVLSEDGDASSEKGDTLQAYLDDATHYLEIDMNIRDFKSLCKDKSE